MTTIVAAPQQLAELVAAMRPDWDRTRIDGAIAAARNAGWTFTRTAREMILLASTPDSTPADMDAAVRNPLHRNPQPADPHAIPEWTQARQQLESDRADVQDGAA